MPKRGILKILFLSILSILLFIPNCYAVTSAATVSSNKTEVKPGETVEVYIDLGIQSIGYDLKVSLNNKDLIKEREMKTDTGNGNVDRIYLVQVVPEAQRILYEPGTRLAVYKYTLADNITENKTLEITVSGDVAGKNSSEKNSVNEKISISVTPTDTTKPEEKPEEKTEQKTEEKPIEQKENETPETKPEKNDGKIVVKDNNDDEPSKTVTIGDDGKETTKQPAKKSDTQSPTKLPATGNDKLGIILIVSGLVIIQGVAFVAYKKTKTK